MFYLYVAIAVFLMFTLIKNRRVVASASLDKLIRQSARYATAAQQDASPLIATLHANYAAAYLYAAKDIASDSQIHNSTGVDIMKLKEHIVNIQDMVTKRTVEKCPAFAGEVDLYLATIAGEA
jgi:hypothetical protein|tara:strand:+ start:5122 stop:5490 length:369 start_codon:yes stop_codon:yes gene_type:complete